MTDTTNPAAASVAIRVQASLRSELARLEEMAVAVRADRSDALHQFRVSARRARAVVRAARPVIGDHYDALDVELRWLGAETGPARDLEVLQANLEPVVAELDDDEEGGRAILAVVQADQEIARQRVIDALLSERFSTLLDVFRSATVAPAAVVGDESPHSIARGQVERLWKARRRLGDDPTDIALHAFRIKVKRTRYAVEVLVGRDVDDAKDLIKALRNLQDLIGVHQDAHVAEERIRAYAVPGAELAAGRIIERERSIRARVRQRLPAAWRRLAQASE
jgi:CHAD domain-containing protein